MKEMDEQTAEKILAAHVNSLVSAKLKPVGEMIVGLEAVIATVIVALHNEGSLPSQKTLRALEKLQDTMLGLENHDSARIVRHIVSQVELALGLEPLHQTH